MTLTTRDVARFVPPERAITRRGFLKGGFGLAGMFGTVGGGGGVAYGVSEAAFALTVTSYRPVLPQWPAGQKLTIAVIADLHAGGPNMGLGRVREVVDTTNSLGCDLIVLLGDYIATHHFITERLPYVAWADELARLRAPLGAYAVLGNHDWWSDVDGIRGALTHARIPVLENQALPLGDGRQRFWLAGLGDQAAHRLGGGRFRGVDDLPRTLAQVRGSEPLILLAHEPDIFVNMPDRVALTLAGHTHGGQVRIPLIWPFFVPSAYGARFAYGHIVERNRHMIVSGGIGTSQLPIRIGVPPEILRIELGT